MMRTLAVSQAETIDLQYDSSIFFPSPFTEASCRRVYRHQASLPPTACSCRRLIGYKSPGSQPGHDCCGPPGLPELIPTQIQMNK